MKIPLHGCSIIADILEVPSELSFRPAAPMGGQLLNPHFHEAGPADASRALQLADAAFPTFQNTAPNERAAFLEQIAEEIMALGDRLLERCHEETALPIDRLTGERGRTVGQLKAFAALIREGSWVDARIDTAMPDRKPLPRADLRRMLVPLGPVVVFGASNFPLAFSVAGGDTASAFAAGCPVVVRAHPAHPGTSELVGMAIQRAVQHCKLPSGIFSMLQGTTHDVGIALVSHPLTTAVGFTGSHRGGRALFNAAAQRPAPIPVFAEMSSVNPMFLMPGALAERAEAIAEGLRNSVTMGVGQFCTKPGIVFAVGGPDLQKFVSTLDKAIFQSAPASMLHPGIRHAYEFSVERVRKVAGVSVLSQSELAPAPDKTQAVAFLMSTDLATFLANPELHEEIFGPSVLIVDCPSHTDMVEAAQRLDGQLTATLHVGAGDMALIPDLVRVLERKAGRLVWNGFPTGVEVCPAMQHGGPYPATTDSRFTSVGTGAIQRWARPVCFQNFPASTLPAALQDENPQQILRTVNGTQTRDRV